MPAIYAALGKRLGETDGYRTQPHVWALREAVLLAIGCVNSINLLAIS